MRSFILFIILFISVTLYSCQEQVRFCDENNVAEFCFDNTTGDTAFVHINADELVIPPHLEICDFFSSGIVEYYIVVGDSDGPSDSISVVDCQNFDITI